MGKVNFSDENTKTFAHYWYCSMCWLNLMGMAIICGFYHCSIVYSAIAIVVHHHLSSCGVFAFNFILSQMIHLVAFQRMKVKLFTLCSDFSQFRFFFRPTNFISMRTHAHTHSFAQSEHLCLLVTNIWPDSLEKKKKKSFLTKATN